jgi:mannosyltransferase
MPSDRTRSLPVMRQPASPGDAGARSERAATWLRYWIGAVLVAAVALRFLTTSPMWLDEAQTVNIAGRSFPHLFSALRHDGSPPLYYVVLHIWMAFFGTSSFAARALSGVFSVAALAGRS